jgi:hypothetical protein
MLKIEKFKNSDLYKCMLFNPDRGLVDNAYLTQPVQIATQSDWSAFAESPRQGMAASAIQYATGRSTQVWATTHQSWQGTQPLELHFSFAFIAVNDAYEEVYEPTKKLLTWPLPEDNANPIKTPISLKGDGIEVWIGGEGNLVIDMLLPRTANVTYVNKYDQNGLPIRGDMEVAFTTMRAMSAQDVLAWFA